MRSTGTVQFQVGGLAEAAAQRHLGKDRLKME
jgi:hypothetical protein